MRRETLKKSGITIGFFIIALITGLSVGLTRKGADIIHQSKKASEKGVIPWTEISQAGGGFLMAIGTYLPVIIVILAVYLLVKRKISVR